MQQETCKAVSDNIYINMLLPNDVPYDSLLPLYFPKDDYAIDWKNMVIATQRLFLALLVGANFYGHRSDK